MTAGEGSDVYLGLGSNLGDRAANLRMALAFLEPLVHVEDVSSLYRSQPVGPQAQPDFFNAVCRGRTGLAPEALLRHVKQVEFEIGRRPGPRWGPRPVDIDILLYEDRVMETAHVVLPHPEIEGRAFVLLPLAEIAPHYVHPVLKRSAAELAGALDDAARAAVRVVQAGGWHRRSRET